MTGKLSLFLMGRMYMEKQTKTYIDKLATENAKFCIIALTGKVRAGTSDVCKLLTDSEFPDSATRPANTCGHDMREIRENLIVYRYLHHNWNSFIHLSITDIIVSFILDSDIEILQKSYIENMPERTVYDVLSEAVNKVKDSLDEVIEKACKISKILLYSDGQSSINIEDITKVDKEIRKYCLSEYSCFTVETLRNHWIETKDRLYNKNTIMNDFMFCFGYLSILRTKFRDFLGKNNYTITFQKYGNNIRAFGEAVVESGRQLEVEKVFSIPERANKFIKLLRFYRPDTSISTPLDKTHKNPVFIVINNFKNIFEAYYFKKRYSAFYLIAVSCDENMRKAKFEDMNKFRLAELRENLSSGKRIYTRTKERIKEKGGLTRELRLPLGLNEAEYTFLDEILKQNDTLLKNAYDNNTANFILQDVITCVENADIFVTRNYEEPDYKCDYALIHQLARIITLILHPGLLTPTKMEQCMQIAMSAKLNSGCLSRQVGAVVTDSEYNILSLGWNDAPCGDESCIRRNLYDLFRKQDEEAYSEYELYNNEFREYLDVIKGDLNDRKSCLHGLPLAFCFKDIYQNIIKQRDQIYTRALHGEERALVACDREKAKGGYLFTTSSPCELCAKKAKEAKVSKIYYIEQYPGISRSHIINYGRKESRAAYELFVGAVGEAYVKLYTPVVPYKDELAILDFSPKTIYKRLTESNDPNDMDNKNQKDEKEFLQRQNVEQMNQLQQDR